MHVGKLALGASMLLALHGCGGGPTCGPNTKLSADGTMCVSTSTPVDAGTCPDAPMVDAGATTVCGANETLVNGVCVANTMGCGPNTAMNDAGVCVPNKSICGPNTQLSDGGVCVLAASACQATGTILDPATGACQAPSPGTLVDTHNFIHGFANIYYQSMNDAGIVYLPIGGTDMQTATVPDTTLLYNKLGSPMGGALITLRYPNYPSGPDKMQFTALDPKYQLSLGDWKKCTGSTTWYKVTINGKNLYKQVVDIAGCIPNSLYTVWLFTSPDGTRASAVTSAPSGGLPNVMQTDPNGAGHFERNLDPNVWTKSATAVPYAGTHMEPGMTPDINTYPNAAAVTLVFWHSDAQTNGNAVYCVRDMNNNCVTPPPGIVHIGVSGVDSHTQLIDEPGTKLSELQPY